MARRLLLQHTSSSPRRFFSSASAYVRDTLDELIVGESSEDKRAKLRSLKAIWEQKEETITFAHLKRHHIAVAALTIDLLRAKGLNDTRGLFEYLQHNILDKHPTTHGRRGSEAVWAHALRLDPVLQSCLRKHLGPSANLPAHWVALDQHLSQHVHAGQDLEQHDGIIVFQSDFLSPEQCSSFVCLGSAVGVDVEPATLRSNSSSLSHTSSG